MRLTSSTQGPISASVPIWARLATSLAVWLGTLDCLETRWSSTSVASWFALEAFALFSEVLQAFLACDGRPAQVLEVFFQEWTLGVPMPKREVHTPDHYSDSWRSTAQTPRVQVPKYRV